MVENEYLRAGLDRCSQGKKKTKHVERFGCSYILGREEKSCVFGCMYCHEC